MKWKITGFMVILCILCGIAMLFLGIRGTFKLKKTIGNYETTEGYFGDYSIYNSDRHGTTYRLTYYYVVDGQEYSVSTDYGTNYIPERNSKKTIKYNPEQPQEAVITGSNSRVFLIFMGFFFIVIPLFVGYGALTAAGYMRELPMSIMDFAIGFVFAGIGAGFLYFQAGSFSIGEVFKSMGLWIAIPLMFIVVGVYLIIRSFFSKKKEKRRKRRNI